MKKNILIIISVFLFVSGCKNNEPVKKEEAPAKKESAIKPEDDFFAQEQVPLDPSQILSPMETIKQIDVKVDGYKSGENLSEEDQSNNLKIKKEIVRGTFDLVELCKLSLGTHWNEITETQQKDFVNLMMRLLEKRALLSKERVKESGKPYTVNYKKETFLDNEKKKAKVETTIVIPSEKLSMNVSYKLLLSPYGWKVFDILVDDASLVENYKFQFDSVIKKSGFDELVSRMKGKLDKLGKE